MEVTDDLSDPVISRDPFGYFGQLRENDPVHRNQHFGGYIITRYDDVKQCLRDNDHLAVSTQAERLKSGPHDMPTTSSMFPHMVIYLDPPDHTTLRRVISEEFNPQFVEEQRSYVEERSTELLDTIQSEDPDEVKLIRDFSLPLPVEVISKIMGFPEEDVTKVAEWATKIAYTLTHQYEQPNRHQKTEQAMREFADYLQDVVKDRKSDPQEDLITHLLQAEIDGHTLDDDEVIATTILLLFAGHETTAKQVANSVFELLRNRDQFELLQSDPSLAESATEELLRYHGAAKSATRGVTNDLDLHDTTIEEGERVLLSIAAANRDPRAFDNPDTLDITRDPDNAHLAFGSGIHTCLGAPLARLELEIVLPKLVQTFPDMELATDEDKIEWVQSLIVQGPKELPLKV